MNELSVKLESRLLQESKQDMLDILLEAISNIQSYNGSSVTHCVVEALGGVSYETDDGKEMISYPKYNK